MGRGKPLTEAEKAKISKLKDYDKMSNRQIAMEIGRGECVVRNFLKDRENYGRNQVIGRPTVLTSAEKRR